MTPAGVKGYITCGAKSSYNLLAQDETIVISYWDDDYLEDELIERDWYYYDVFGW